MKALVLLILFSTSHLTMGQIANLTGVNGELMRGEEAKILNRDVYLLANGEFTEGYIILGGKKFEGVFLRYNTLLDQIEIGDPLNTDDGSYMILDDSGASEIALDRKGPGIYGTHLIKVNDTWMKVIEDNFLYKKITSSFIEIPPAFNSAEITQKTVRMELYYYRKDTGYKSFQLNKKEVLGVLDDPAGGMAFAKKNKLKYKEIGNVLKILKYDSDN